MEFIVKEQEMNMPKITPALMAQVFSEEVTAILPSDNFIKRSNTQRNLNADIKLRKKKSEGQIKAHKDNPSIHNAKTQIMVNRHANMDKETKQEMYDKIADSNSIGEELYNQIYSLCWGVERLKLRKMWKDLGIKFGVSDWLIMVISNGDHHYTNIELHKKNLDEFNANNLTCPHCGLTVEVISSSFKRYHFDKCKHK